jgi:aerobic carbon-monoxide dehydrogenase large subunit
MNSDSRRYVGQSIARKEDPNLLAGDGRFIGDIVLPRMMDIAFLRSSLPHARIRHIDASRARALKGVVAVFTGAEIQPLVAPVPGMQNIPSKQWRQLVEHDINIPDQPVLAAAKVRHVGEALAVVVAENRYIAEDAIELIDVSFEPLAPVIEIDHALAADAPKVHDELRSNVVATFRVKKGDAVSALAAAPKKLRGTFYNHRHVAAPIECRGVIADYDPRTDSITVWCSTQVVHWVRREVAKSLDMAQSRVRCIAPDVGGGFGLKGHVYPEDILIPFLAKHLRRPVRWLEDRQENLASSAHSRDDRHEVEVGFDGSGRILALRDSFVKNSGAYTPVGISDPMNTISHMMGPYRVPHLDASAKVVVTNKGPNAPYRGAGRPEAVFVMERVMDLIAQELDIDAVDVRRRNMVQVAEMPYASGVPYRDGTPAVYDGGNYPVVFEKAISALGGIAEIRAEQRNAWEQGRYLGLGIGSYVEGTGSGPFEGATVRLEPSGTFHVATGACAQGQGHKTIFAQVAADEWGVSPDEINVVISDTQAIAHGHGTIASRSAVVSSAAIRLASRVLRKKVLAIAAHILKQAPEDLELRDGRVFNSRKSNMSLSLREVAAAAMPGPTDMRPPGLAGGLEVTEYFEPPTVTWAYATHAALIEIDSRSLAPRILKYVVAHDCGVVINPMIAEGQILGAVAQGIGGALLEEIVYDEGGQLLTGSLADYLIPTASDIPAIEIHHIETPSTLNELGLKGLGEGGTIPPGAVIVNAVCDALRPIGFQLFSTPVRNSDILAAFQKHSKASGLASQLHVLNR